MKLDEILDRLPFEIAARLESDPFYKDIPIVVAVKGNVRQEYERQQAMITEKGGKIGVAVIILQIQANDMYPGVVGGPMKLRPAIQVIENVELNQGDGGTQKSARKIARHTVKNLKLTCFVDFVQAMTCDVPAIEPIDASDLGPATVIEQVNFVCQEMSDEKVLVCTSPTISQVEGQNQIQMTCTTAGAQIWYTTDGSFPYPGNATQFAQSKSQLYAGPINIEPNQPTAFRMMAHLDGWIDSSIQFFDVNITN